MIIETDRLILREYTIRDFEALYEIMSDPETMQHYPKPFDEERTKNWIEWNLNNYKEYGFGLWAVVLKETSEFIGDCGLTIQNIDGEYLPEIGYHIHKKYWRRGFGSEAAKAVRDWAFENTKYDRLYSYMKYTNIGSYSTAAANGMRKIKEYPDEKNGISYAYAITRGEWEELKNNLKIRKMKIEDYEAVYGLWLSCKGMGLNSVDDSREGIEKFLRRNPDTCFVAERDGVIVGAIIAGSDGRRGYIYHTAVSPDQMRQGIASKLVEAVMSALESIGITKAALVVFDRNADGNAFWEKSGFSVREDLVYRNRSIADMTRIDT